MNEKVFDVGGVELHVDERNFGADGGPLCTRLRRNGRRKHSTSPFRLLSQGPHIITTIPPGRMISGISIKRVCQIQSHGRLKQLGQNLVEMIHTAGYSSVADNVDQAAVAQVLPEVESLMRGET